MRSGGFLSIKVISCREVLIGPLLMDLSKCHVKEEKIINTCNILVYMNILAFVYIDIGVVDIYNISKYSFLLYVPLTCLQTTFAFK